MQVTFARDMKVDDATSRQPQLLAGWRAAAFEEGGERQALTFT